MRLINTRTLKLEEFNEVNRPPYAILSHTWGDEEITFQQMQGDTSQLARKAGYQKIVGTCNVALRSNLKYAWVDTCCIDKTSSAELSEAINSMFRWYEDAEICYAYLPGVHRPFDGYHTILNSRWFTRGWTLQELIAPRHLIFYAANWEYINSRSNLSEGIARVTGIDERLLQDNRAKAGSILASSSIAQRMSWASRRQTTRTEDLAYCLLGIFDINMPLLYGEGTKAFTRLQEEIIRHTDDQSIFAWEHWGDIFEPSTTTSFLAPSPAAFIQSGKIGQVDTGEESAPFSLTNRGIQIDLRVWWFEDHPYGIMPCRHHHKGTKFLRIKLQQLNGPRYFRAPNAPLEWAEEWVWKEARKTPVYLMIAPPPVRDRIPPGSFLVKSPYYTTVHCLSEGYTWSPATGLVTMDEPEYRPRRKTELHLVLGSRSYKGDSCSEYLTLSIWVRRPHGYTELEWVTYNLRSSGPEGQLQNRDQSLETFFAKVERQAIFGQKVIVIQVFSRKTQSGISMRLQWARIRLGRLLDKLLFDTLGADLPWFFIAFSESFQQTILLRPVLIVAAVVIMWPIQDFELESSSIERMKDVILSSFDVNSIMSMVFGPFYLLVFWFNFPLVESLHPALEVVCWLLLWPSLSFLIIRLIFWKYIVAIGSVYRCLVMINRDLSQRGY